LILGKIIEIAATKCYNLKLKFTKFDFGWGSTHTLLGELTALPNPLAGFNGTSKGREERKDGRKGKGERKEQGKKEEGRREDGEGKEREGRGGKGTSCVPPVPN